MGKLLSKADKASKMEYKDGVNEITILSLENAGDGDKIRADEIRRQISTPILKLATIASQTSLQKYTTEFELTPSSRNPSVRDLPLTYQEYEELPIRPARQQETTASQTPACKSTSVPIIKLTPSASVFHRHSEQFRTPIQLEELRFPKIKPQRQKASLRTSVKPPPTPIQPQPVQLPQTLLALQRQPTRIKFDKGDHEERGFLLAQRLAANRSRNAKSLWENRPRKSTANVPTAKPMREKIPRTATISKGSDENLTVNYLNADYVESASSTVIHDTSKIKGEVNEWKEHGNVEKGHDIIDFSTKTPSNSGLDTSAGISSRITKIENVETVKSGPKIGSKIPKAQSPKAEVTPEINESSTKIEEKSINKTIQKRKLKVKGLKQFVKSHGNCHPPAWARDFPIKSKYHVDNFLYDFEEGPKAPSRPTEQMLNCKKKSGRCDACGTFSVDACRCCKKCPYDCVCPKPPTTFPSLDTAFGPGWSQAQKVICELTQDERRAPVGGKREFNTEGSPPHLKCQIDVLNPSRNPAEGNNPHHQNNHGQGPPPGPGYYPPPQQGYYPQMPGYGYYAPPPPMYPSYYPPPMPQMFMPPPPSYYPPQPPPPPPPQQMYPSGGQYGSPYGAEPPSNYYSYR